jgi:phage repressor protein C with HTH and peptisase S24 domain/predicted XRE-type DNA-binding protein
MSKLSETLSARAAELGISQTELADKVGIAQPSISELFSGGVASPRKWREIAMALQIPEEEMRQMMIEAGRESGKTTRLPRSISKVPIDVLLRRQDLRNFDEPNGRVDRNTPIPASIRPGKLIPVLGEAVGGIDGRYQFNGSVIDYVACPPSLEGVPGAYAVYVDGESMSPRYRPGEVVWVHPHKPARRGDDVIVQVHPDEEGVPPYGFIKEFIGWQGDHLTLRQHNPDSQIRFDRDDVVSVHPIVLSGKY